jgi:hypothetical protein
MPPKAIPLGPNGFLEAIRNSTEAIVDMMARMAIVDQKLDAFRVSINDDGTFDIVDFTMPTRGDKLRKNIPQEDVPQWVMQAVSMLRITDTGNLVEGVGFKVSDRVYYIEDRGEADGQQ